MAGTTVVINAVSLIANLLSILSLANLSIKHNIVGWPYVFIFVNAVIIIGNAHIVIRELRKIQNF